VTEAPGWSALTATQATVARGFLAGFDVPPPRRHLVVYLSGAHAYGFPSPDSDLDLKCVHVAPTAALVGLSAVAPAADVLTVIDGVEIDYGTNELAPVLRGCLKGNGNYLERLLGRMVLAADAELAALRPLVRAGLSRMALNHYRGFAFSQYRGAAQAMTAKKVLYVLRTALTGIHLLATGEMEIDLTRLAAHHPIDGVADLIAIKQQGERVVLTEADLARWKGEMDRVLAALDAAYPTSILPPTPPDDAAASLDAWLVDLRRRTF
jgi:predicted nucleotidyltransferase